MLNLKNGSHIVLIELINKKFLHKKYVSDIILIYRVLKYLYTTPF